MGGEPNVVEGNIKCFGAVGKCQANMLKQHGGLADTLGSLDTDEPFVPVYALVQIAKVTDRSIFQPTVVCAK